LKELCLRIALPAPELHTILVKSSMLVTSCMRIACLQQVKAGRMDFNDFLTRGLVEYVDVNEENNSLIALYEADITPQVRVGHIFCPTCLLMGDTQWA
jgi:RNA polymerase Rpb2, domain 5